MEDLTADAAKRILDILPACVCPLVYICAVCLRKDCPLQDPRTNHEKSYLLLIEIESAWCPLVSGFDGDFWIAALLCW